MVADASDRGLSSAWPSCAARQLQLLPGAEGAWRSSRRSPQPDRGRVWPSVIELWTEDPRQHRSRRQEYRAPGQAGGPAEGATSSARTRPSPPWLPPSAAAGWASAPKRKPVSFIFVGLHRRGQDRAGQAAGRRPVRHPGRPDPPGYVRVHGEALRLPASSARRPAMWAMTRPDS